MRPTVLGQMLVLVVGGLACSGNEAPPAEAPLVEYWAHSPPACMPDEVREYVCDDLLPRGGALPAAEPYSDCPANLEGHAGRVRPEPPVAVFDADYTSYMRKRSSPGHACCFSWCSPLEVVDPAGLTGRERCEKALAFREHFCVDEPEQGTRLSAGGQYPSCPVAITPPAGAVYEAPPAVVLDAAYTSSRRAEGFNECCYGWCSIAPPGTGLYDAPK